MVDILNRFPELLPREPESIFRRFVEAHEEELDEYSDDIEAIKLSRQVDNATGNDLDRIGRLFGPVGRRLGRDDPTYRRYLKSVVQAFSGRGTDLSMRRAFAAALDIDVDDVEITENTVDVEYDVVFYDWNDHRVTSIYEIAQIVDPSGVEQNDVRYSVPPDNPQAADDVAFTDGTQVLDDADASVDGILVNITLMETFEELVNSDDITQEIEDAFTEDTDIVEEVTDEVDEDAGTDESSSADAETDSVEIGTDSAQWDYSSWDDMEWDYDGRFIDESPSEVLVEEDVDADSSDTNNCGDLSEEEVTDDSTADGSTGDDATATETSTVLWDDGDWDSMRFAHT